MKIETTVTLPEQKEEEKKYPYWGMHTIEQDLVVGFYEPNSGVVIQGNKKYGYLHHATNWAEHNFTHLPSGTKIIMEVK